MTRVLCRVCGANTDAFLCTLHTNDLEKLLAELPSLTRDLDITASRQARVDNTIRPTDVPIELMQTELHEARRIAAPLRSRDAKIALPATPMPYSRGAADLHSHVVNAVLTWARHIAEVRGIDLPDPEPVRVVTEHRMSPAPGLLIEVCTWTWQRPPVTVGTVCTWLVAHIESVRQDEAAAVMLDEVRALTARIHAVIDRNDPDVFAGQCVEQTIRLYPGPGGALIPDVRPCKTDLLAGKDDEKVTCPKCGALYVVAEQRDKMRGLVVDVIATTSEIANGLTNLARQVTPSMIRQMAYRGEIPQRGTLDDSALYRVGDVLEVLERREERRQQLPEKRSPSRKLGA